MPDLPLRHLSIRVPWHDSGWLGTVCADPIGNASCLRLANIHDARDDAVEVRLAGRSLAEVRAAEQPPCVAERASFMAPFPVTRVVRHPYAATSKAYAHYEPTDLTIPEYAAGCVPFRWLLRDNAAEIAEALDIVYHDEAEDEARAVMKFESAWVQNVENQRRLLDGFFSAVQPGASLAFFYAKEVPFTEDPRRVLVGVGRVNSVGTNIEYNYAEDGPSRSLIWERPIGHSIRPDAADGFLLPYHAALARAAEDPTFDPAELAVFAPDEAFDEFSYVTEHVTHDHAIAALLNIVEGLERAARLLGTNHEAELQWASDRLGELWRLRGPFPGLGAALHAFDIPHANLFAHAVTSQLGANEDPWPLVAKAIADPGILGGPWRGRIGPTTAKVFAALPAERRALLELLARFELTNDQAERLYVKEVRAKAKIAASDAQLLANPYLIFETDRLAEDRVAVRTVDRGVFPAPAVRDAHPLPAPSRVLEAVDERRVRAHLVDALEARAAAGDTLATQDDLVLDVREAPLDPPCPVSADVLDVLRPGFAPTIETVPLASERVALQLERFATVGAGIRGEFTKRARAKKRHVVDADWRAELEGLLGAADPDDADELRARDEKVAALEELAAARASVLIGPAGTGKTTLLAALCGHAAVRDAGVLLLAPTGKARVQLEKGLSRARSSVRARTIAEFLVKSERFLPETGIYCRSDRPKVAEFGTLIIDEASMLTEEQLDAVLDAVSNVQRLILVGDPRQLPPIGAGRPFVDLVAFLAPDGRSAFPQVGPSYAELTVRRRQSGADRLDLDLAEWFGGGAPSVLADEAWAAVLAGERSDTIRFEQWDDAPDVFPLLLRVLSEEIDAIDGPDDEEGFGVSLGGVRGKNGGVFFNQAWKDRKGSGEAAESWQVLSPVRGGAHGVSELNRNIQRQFRKQAIEYAKASGWGRKTPAPMGPEGIVYGDKVMNVSNHRHKQVWPEQRTDVDPPTEALRYIANGEIGMVVGRFKRQGQKGLPKNLEVEFSTQLGFGYKFWPNDVPREGDGFLELAYAVTIHKSQGSEFGVTFLVLPNPCRLLSRELLYTALTRQTDKVIVLHQGPLAEMLAYSSAGNSETAGRLTNLFVEPRPVEVNGRFLEEGLIHRTADGTLVRSKSEVIIADALAAHGVDYAYEQPFVGTDGSRRYPDFTVEDAASGERYLWEHLGMLEVPKYRAAWEKKLAWYARQGVLPHADGGGPNGTLVMTRDDAHGGIDSAELQTLIRDLFA